MKVSQAYLSAIVVLALKAGGRGARARDLGATEGHTVAGKDSVLPSADKRGIRGGEEVLPTERGYLSTDGSAGQGLRVHELYTFGAPSVTWWPINAPGHKCVKGLRVYNENVMVWSWWHPADFASQINQDLGHPRMDTLMLNNQDPQFWNHNGGHDTAKYLYYPCKDEESDDQEHYWWPKNQQPNTAIHGMNNNYFPRLTYFFYGREHGVDEATNDIENLYDKPTTDKGVPEDLVQNALLYGLMAQMNYEEVSLTLGEFYEQHHHLPPESGWELINEGVVLSGEVVAMDRDNLRLIKNRNTNECVFTFEGSNQDETGGQVYDLGRFTVRGLVTWCGVHDLMQGVKDELWTIVHSPAYQTFKPYLRQCQKVICAGHSLGGALCDMWYHLANNGVEDRNDTDCWTKLAW